MLETIATDHAAPAELRIQALATIAEYCACSNQLTARWVPKLLALADPTGNTGSTDGSGGGSNGGSDGGSDGDREVRVAAIAVWARIGPLGQEEQRVANLVRDDDAHVRLAAVTAIFDMVLAHKVSPATQTPTQPTQL